MNDATRREFALLDWLVARRPPDSSGVYSLAEMFGGNPPVGDETLWMDTLQDLDQRGLIRTAIVLDFFASGVRLTAGGHAETLRRHERRDDPLQRAIGCRRGLLLWAYGLDKAAPVTGFLSSPHASREGAVFSERDIDAAVTYLVDEGLLYASDGTDSDAVPVILVRLTARGKRHLEEHDSERSDRGNVVYVMGDNNGSLNIGNRDVTQHGPTAQLRPEPASATVPRELAKLGGTVPLPQFERWAVLPQARLALFARDWMSPFLSGASNDPKTEFRFIWRLACSEWPTSLRPKSISDALIDLLRGPEVMDAVARHAEVADLAWTRYADQGRTSFGALLRADKDTGEPTAWARFNPPPTDEHSLFGRELGCADLLIAIRHGHGKAARKAMTLTEWEQTFKAWLQRTLEVAAFLARFGADLAAEPVARVAVAVSTTTDMGEIVDLTSMSRIPGTTTLPWFLASAAANASGISVADLSRAWMTTMCEDVLHLDDYDLTNR
ncbi:hypothetical protein AB0C12_43165 [Actinoplanes sp. NPDC048967]|uniref:hypothetical protein n=1 Tax=Actinoplanes sp. NPDC048967 TaxID=3155269 RepID=UPI0033D56453